jgi:hypothetical protein
MICLTKAQRNALFRLFQRDFPVLRLHALPRGVRKPGRGEQPLSLTADR